MRKHLAILLGIIILLSATACAGNRNVQQAPGQNGPAEDNNQPEGQQGNRVVYKDGTYDAKGDEWKYGNEDATVVINDGMIKSVVLRRLDKEGNEVNYNNWTGKEIDGKLYPNLKQYRLDLADRMIERQTYDVDSISGATISCENWKLAVKRALEKAKQ